LQDVAKASVRLYHGAMLASSLCMLLLFAGPASSAGLPVADRAPASRALDGQELLRIGDLHAVQNHVQEAMPYYQRALATFRSAGNRRGEATALGSMADLLERQGRYAEAGPLLRDEVSIWAALAEPRAHGRALLGVGRIAEASGQGMAAQRAYEQAEVLFQRARDRAGRGEARIRLGRLLTGQDLIVEGRALLQAALADARERADRAQQVLALGAIGDGYVREGEGAAAHPLFEEGLALAEAQQDLRAEAGLRTRLAWLSGDSGQSGEAMAMAGRALALYQTLKDRGREAEAWSLIGSLAFADGNLVLAAEQHERALALFRALRDQNKEAASLVNLALVYDAQSLAQDAADTRHKAILLLQSAQ